MPGEIAFLIEGLWHILVLLLLVIGLKSPNVYAILYYDPIYYDISIIP